MRAPIGPLLEQALVELSQWLARVQQYSSKHPACAALGEKVLATFARVLDIEATITFTILADNVMMGEIPASHPAIRLRTAPELHERGVLGIRFYRGVTMEELTNFVELCTLPVQAIFDAGGLARLATSRGILHVVVDEIAHDITADERDAQKRRARGRAFHGEAMRRLLAGRRFALADFNAALQELLEPTEIALTILGENGTNVATGFAVVCWMVREADNAAGATPLYPKLEAILLGLPPSLHVRILLDCPSLQTPLRQALVWALDKVEEGKLAKILFPALRSHGGQLDLVLYALSMATPHRGRRLSILRRVALRLYDLPAEDPASTELLEIVARLPAGADSHLAERQLLAPHARRALGIARAEPPVIPAELASAPVPPFDGKRVVAELVVMASRTRHFEELRVKLPTVAVTLARAGSAEAVIGLIHGLNSTQRPEMKDAVIRTMKDVASPEVSSQVLSDLDARSVELEGKALEELAANVRIFVALRPHAVLECLRTSESRKMRRVLVDTLAKAGPKLLPLARQGLAAPEWYFVRNLVTVVARLGGGAADFINVARHPDPRVRLEVMRALRLVQLDGAAMDIVAGGMIDRTGEVQRAASVVLRGELLSPGAVAALQRFCADENQPEELRQKAVEALGRCPLDVGAAALFAIMQPQGLIEQSSLRDVAAVALRGSPARAAPQYFAEGLRSAAWRVRKACERAAGGGT